MGDLVVSRRGEMTVKKADSQDSGSFTAGFISPGAPFWEIVTVNQSQFYPRVSVTPDLSLLDEGFDGKPLQKDNFLLLVNILH